MASCDGKWPGSDVICPAVTGSGCKRPRMHILGTFELVHGVTRRRWQSRDRKWHHVTSHARKGPEVTSLDRNSPGSGCGRPRTHVLSAFELLRGCNSQDLAANDKKWRHVTLWLEVTRSDVFWPGNQLEVAVDGQKLVLCTFELLLGCNTEEVGITWQKVTSRNLTWPEVTSFHRKTLEVAVGGRKFAFGVCLSSYRAVTRRRWQWRDKKCHVNLHDWKLPAIDIIWPGSHLEVAIDSQKLAFCVRLTSYRAVTHCRWQSRNRKSRPVTLPDRKSPGTDIIWPEVTWKWCRRPKGSVTGTFELL